MIDEHAAAILALLDADNGPPPLTVFDGFVPTGTDPQVTPYVVVYFEASFPDLAFAGASYTFEMRATCHSVAGGGREVRMVADRVTAALRDVTPPVTGRKCWPIRWEEGSPPLRHEKTGQLVMDQVDVYVLRSVPG